MRAATLLIALAAMSAVAAGTVVFEEKFNDDWTQRWKISDWKKSSGEQGEWKHTAGLWHADEADKGIQTSPDARFHNAYAEFPATFSNEGKDLVLQFQVKHEQSLDCGGGYIKLVPASSKDSMPSFSGETPYSIMFGPDVCGATKRVHVIFTYKGENLLIKKTIAPNMDQLSHVYTLIVKPDNTYAVLIDGVEKAAGSLYEDWDFLKPKTIKDPEAKKPEDWDERAQIVDPEDKKPDGWDDIPEQIPDPEAKKPEDWDDEDDGEWEAPMIPNPEFKGEWKPKMIANPDYKGIWEAPDIDNPEFVDDPLIYKYDDLAYVGFELWQVKSGTIFDNILVTDDVEYAAKFRDETWGAMKDAEKAEFDKIEAAKQEEMAAKAKAEAAEREAMGEDEEEDDEYEGGDAEEDEYEGEDEYDHTEL